MTLGCNIINRLIHEKLQEPLRAYLQLTHHTPMATCNNIKVNLDPKHPGKKHAFAKSNRKSSIMIPACTEMAVQATTVNLKQTFEAIVPPWWPGSSSKIIKVNCYVRHNFI